MSLQRLDLPNHEQAIALHTVGHLINRRAMRTDQGAVRWRIWTEIGVSTAEKLLAAPSGKYLAALNGIAAVKMLENWLRTHTPPVLAWVDCPATHDLPLRTTHDLALAAGLLAVGLVPQPHLHANDGTVGALRFPSAAVDFLATVPAPGAVSHTPMDTHFHYAAQAAANWMAHCRLDPAGAKDYILLLKGHGTRSAVVSRSLMDATGKREVQMPDGTSTIVRANFKDQVRQHLIGV